jgi:PAS domain S-box-containing protein
MKFLDEGFLLEIKNLLDILPDGILIHRDDKILYANSTLLKLLHYEKPEELIGLSPLSLVHPEKRALSQERVKAMASGSGTLYNPRIETALLGKDGHPVDVEADSFTITLDGEPAILGLIRDIRQRKRERDHLREKEIFMESAQRLGRMGGWTLDLGPEKRAQWSKETFRILGLDENNTEPNQEIFYERVHPEDLAKVRTALQDSLQLDFSYYATHRIVQPNGNLRWVRAFAETIRDEDGKPVKMIGVIQDITDQRLGDETLKASENRFKGVYEGALDGMIIIDNAGAILEINGVACQLLGAGREALLGEQLRDFYEVGFDLDHARETTSRTGRFKEEMKLKRRNGGEWEAELDVKGQILPGQTLVVIRDVTEKKQLRQKIAMNDKLATVGTLAAGIAHEVNNPLGYILGNLELMKGLLAKMKPVKDKPAGEVEVAPEFYSDLQMNVLETIRGAERIRDIVRGLKTFSRTNGDPMASVNINNLVDSAISMTFHEIKYKAKVERHFDTGLPPLIANTTRLQQVFVNLLVNAAHAIPSGNAEQNRILVSTGMEGGRIFIRVSDTGKGIPAEVLPRIFDPFFTTKPVGEGTGLGLSISREIILGYHGDIQVQSEWGKGTTFTVWLPLETGKAVSVKGGDKDTAPLSELRILLVDDEPGNVTLYSHLLRKNKHFVLATSSALEALEILERGLSKIDVIVSDLNMPDMNGVEFYQAVEKRAPALAKKIVFITGGIFADEMEKFLDRIPNPKLDKPFEVEDLLRAISHVAAKK